jgi:hypothetical protein
MKYKIGDKVLVIGGAYDITLPGSEGKVIADRNEGLNKHIVHPDWVCVDFYKVVGSKPTMNQFWINPQHLEKIVKKPVNKWRRIVL